MPSSSPSSTSYTFLGKGNGLVHLHLWGSSSLLRNEIGVIHRGSIGLAVIRAGGKAAVVTSAATGLGQAYAKRLAEEGQHCHC